MDRFISRYTALPTSISTDDADVHGNAFAFAFDQTRVHAATQHFIEQPAKQITTPKRLFLFLEKVFAGSYNQPRNATLTGRHRVPSS